MRKSIQVLKLENKIKTQKFWMDYNKKEKYDIKKLGVFSGGD